MLWLLYAHVGQAAPILPVISTRIKAMVLNFKTTQQAPAVWDEDSIIQRVGATLFTELPSLGLNESDRRIYFRLFLHLAQVSGQSSGEALPHLSDSERTLLGDLKQLVTQSLNKKAARRCGQRKNAIHLNSVEAAWHFNRMKKTPSLEISPDISIEALFSEILVDPLHQGWIAHGLQSGIIPRTRGGSGNALLAQLGRHPELREIRLYRVNDEPVLLTPESQWFFDGLEKEVLDQSSGTYVGYKFLFFPNAVIRTAHLSDASSKASVPLYLLARVEESEMFLETDDAIEARWIERQHLMQALYQRREEALELLKEDPEQARDLLSEVAEEGLPIAAAEAAVLYEPGTHLEKDEENVVYFRNLARAAGITVRPMLVPYEPSRATPIPEEVMNFVNQSESASHASSDADDEAD